MTRALCLFSVPPFPADHAMRAPNWHLARALHEVAHVTLLTWRTPTTTDRSLDALREVADDIIVLPTKPWDRRLAARAGRRWRFVAGGEPHYVQALMEERSLDNESGIRAFQDVLLTQHAADSFDIVVLGEEALTRLPLPSFGATVVLQRMNVFSRIVSDLHRSAGWRRALGAADRRAWARFDRQVMEPVDLALCNTPEVAAAISHLAPQVRCEVVPNGVEITDAPVLPSAGHDLAFIGAMDYAANIDAALWFASACLPEIRRNSAATRFRIVGRDPAPSIRALAGPGIVVTGEVDRLPPACVGARAGVVPLRAGMGIKNKTLELMAMGLPVVTSPSGAEGIDASEEDGLLVVDSAHEFCQEIVSLLRDPLRADHLGRRAQAFVRARHSWAHMRQASRAAVMSAVADRTGAMP